MGQRFGPGLAKVFQKDTGDIDVVGALEHFAKRTRVPCFREVVGDRVLEVMTKGGYRWSHWLTNGEARAIVEDASQARGLAPRSFFDRLPLLGRLLVTGYRGPHRCGLRDADGEELTIGSLPKQIRLVRRVLREASQMNGTDELLLNFYRSYLDDLKVAHRHKLVFVT